MIALPSFQGFTASPQMGPWINPAGFETPLAFYDADPARIVVVAGQVARWVNAIAASGWGDLLPDDGLDAPAPDPAGPAARPAVAIPSHTAGLRAVIAPNYGGQTLTVAWVGRATQAGLVDYQRWGSVVRRNGGAGDFAGPDGVIFGGYAPRPPSFASAAQGALLAGQTEGAPGAWTFYAFRITGAPTSAATTWVGAAKKTDPLPNGAMAFNADSLYLGNSWTGAGHDVGVTGSIAACLVWAEALSDGQLDAVRARMSARFGL
jgi:hypothetical protein